MSCGAEKKPLNPPTLSHLKTVTTVKDTIYKYIDNDTFYIIDGGDLSPKNKKKWAIDGLCAKVTFQPIANKIDNYENYYKIIAIDCQNFDCSFLKNKLVFSNLGGHFSAPKVFFGLLKYDSIPAKWRSKDFETDFIFQYVDAPIPCWKEKWK